MKKLLISLLTVLLFLIATPVYAVEEEPIKFNIETGYDEELDAYFIAIPSGISFAGATKKPVVEIQTYPEAPINKPVVTRYEDGKEITNVTFVDGLVSFEISEGGTYLIKEYVVPTPTPTPSNDYKVVNTSTK